MINKKHQKTSKNIASYVISIFDKIRNKILKITFGNFICNCVKNNLDVFYITI